MKKTLYLLIFILQQLNYYSQNATIKGSVKDATSNEAIPFANVFIEQINSGVPTDLDGRFEFKNINSGLYTVKCSFVGYESKTYAEIIVTPNKPTILDVKLIKSSTSLEVLEITSSPFQKSEESPLSKRSISATEIYRNPGGNRDISRVIQSLPGVASTVSFSLGFVVNWKSL